MINVPKPKWINDSNDIFHCHEVLIDRWPKLLTLFQEKTGRDLVLTCTWRSEGKQQRLYAIGRTEPGKIVTQIDGVTRKSNHNIFPARAIDVAVNVGDPGGKNHVSWDEEMYLPLGPICKQLGLVWGGSWEHFKDLPHVELPSSIA